MCLFPCLDSFRILVVLGRQPHLALVANLVFKVLANTAATIFSGNMEQVAEVFLKRFELFNIKLFLKKTVPVLSHPSLSKKSCLEQIPPCLKSDERLDCFHHLKMSLHLIAILVMNYMTNNFHGL